MWSPGVLRVEGYLRKQVILTKCYWTHGHLWKKSGAPGFSLDVNLAVGSIVINKMLIFEDFVECHHPPQAVSLEAAFEPGLTWVGARCTCSPTGKATAAWSLGPPGIVSAAQCCPAWAPSLVPALAGLVTLDKLLLCSDCTSVSFSVKAC